MTNTSNENERVISVTSYSDFSSVTTLISKKLQ